MDAAVTAVGVLGAVLGGVFVYAGASATCTPGHNCESNGALVGLGVLVLVPSAVIAATYGFSAHYGFSHVADCRARLRE